ncbi:MULTISPECIES: hypothetical protein [Paenibacillus]|uniref:hypothetical protein n=1 Tax=Paenibacillus TaxID=44249 RepID=UPI0011A360D3|nr:MULTISPECIES: hypothetical protein [Paenibacillus]
MPSITDALRARGIGSGQGISQTDLTALIDVTNVAETNNDAIKLDVVNKLNTLNPALNLTTAASWSTIRAAIVSMQYRGAQTITPGPGDIPIPAGYHNGGGKVSAVVVPTSKVLNDTTIAGQKGTMPYLTGVRTPAAVAIWPDNKDLAVYPEKGYQDGGAGGGEIRVTKAHLAQVEPNFVAANIVSGKNIFGLAGKAPTAGYFYDFGTNNFTFLRSTNTYQWNILTGIKKGGHAVLMGIQSNGISCHVMATPGAVYPGDSARLTLKLYDEVTDEAVCTIFDQSFSYGFPGNTYWDYDWFEIDHENGRVRQRPTGGSYSSWFYFSKSTNNSIRLAAEHSVVSTSTAGTNGYLETRITITGISIRT